MARSGKRKYGRLTRWSLSLAAVPVHRGVSARREKRECSQSLQNDGDDDGDSDGKAAGEGRRSVTD